MDTLLSIALCASKGRKAIKSKRERERESERRVADGRRARRRGERIDISPRTFTVKRVDGREWARTSRGKDKDGRRVDEKRWGWLPNSNLGVGRVGKWAQCGVTLRAFALSPSQPLLLFLPRTRDPSSYSVPLASPSRPHGIPRAPPSAL